MFMVTQAPNGRCTLSSRSLSSSSFSYSLQFSSPNPKPLFSHKPKFNSKNIQKPVNLTLATNNTSESRSTDSSSPSPSPSPFNSNKDETVFVGDERIPLEGVIQLDKSQIFSSQLKKWGRVALLSGGDVLALLLFSAIGRFSHGFPVFDMETIHTADPFIAGWFFSAYFLGGYGSEGRGMGASSKAVIAAAKSWAIGIPLGIIIRSATSGHIPPVRFMLVTMGTTAILLIGWRALLFNIFLKENGKKSDVYKRGSPFELFELLTSLVRRW